MRTPLALVAIALASVVALDPASAQSPTDTIAVVDDTSYPALALEPSSATPHVVYSSAATLYHAVKSAGSWLIEPVATGVSSSLKHIDLRLAPNGTPVALYARLGTLECAVRESGGWATHTLDTGTISALALAISPVTGEPVAVWALGPTGPGVAPAIKFARRMAGVWNTQRVDTTSLPPGKLVVGVAVDFADRPLVAWARPGGTVGSGTVLTCATAAGPSGPFTPEPVDSTLSAYLSLAADPASGEPRIAYSALSSVRYADRTGRGQWELTNINLFPSRPPSLTLDAAGNPSVSGTFLTPIGPADLRMPRPHATDGCIIFETGAVELYQRLGAEGTSAFQFVTHLGGGDGTSGDRAAASATPAVTGVAWRTPSADVCGPYAVSLAVVAGQAGVGPGPGMPIALAPVVPNPCRPGANVRLEFGLAQVSGVSLELADLAGRRVDVHEAGRLAAGPHALEWAPAAARPGVYWLTVRADGRRIGTRPLVIMR